MATVIPPAAAAAIAAAATRAVQPSASTRLLRECVFTFDSPESETGIFISLSNHQAFAIDQVPRERRRHPGAASTLFLRQIWRRVRRAPAPAPAADVAAAVPTKVGIGVEGGFQVDAPEFDTVKEASLVVIVAEGTPGATPLPAEKSGSGAGAGAGGNGAFFAFAHPAETKAASPAIPANVLAVCDTMLAALEVEAATEKLTWEEKAEVSVHALDLVQLDNVATISPDPKDWKCAECGQGENLWLNLSDGYIGCGRAQVGGAPGHSHALAHYNATGRAFPLVVKLGTITPAGGDCYSYAPEENDAVEDPNLAAHLAHWGINIMTATKTEKSMAEMSIAFMLTYDFGRITEAGADLVTATGPGLIGCDNLGNTCYMNSALQVFASMPEAKALYARDDTAIKRVLDSAPAEPQNDLLTQTTKLFAFLHSDRYALAEGATAAAASAGTATPAGEGAAAAAVVTAATGGAGDGKAAEAAAKEPPIGGGGKCGFVTPRMFKLIIGRNHPDFCTNQQQDAAHFIEWLYEQLAKAQNGRPAQERLPPLEDGTRTLSELTAFTLQSRLADMQSGGVRYKATKERYLRLNIPVDSATNTGEVTAAKAAVEAAVAKALGEAGVSSEITATIVRDVLAPKPAKRAKVEGADTADAARRIADRVKADMMAAVPKLTVPFAALVSRWRADGSVDDFQSPVTGARGVAISSARLLSRPRYLFVVLNRYTMAADWTQVKIDASVPMPPVIDLGAASAAGGAGSAAGAEYLDVLAPGEGGLQAGETDLDTLAAAAGGGGGGAPAPRPAAAAVEPSGEIIMSLASMGFPEGACARAAVATHNSSVEAAMDWLTSHMDDADFSDPYVPAAAAPVPAPAPAPAASGGGRSGAAAVNAEALATLVDAMGFDTKRATYALRQTGGDVERATDWLFSHSDDPIPDEDEGTGAAAGGAGGGAAAAAAEPAWAAADKAASSRYNLTGIISHLGNNTSSGHYVCHIRKNPHTGLMASSADMLAPAAEGRAKWYIYNDAKVAESQNPPFDVGYLYIYRRADV